jgi:hypothetical protein
MPRSHFDIEQIKSALDGLDHLASTMERKWGIGRLRLVVSDELRLKFDRQAERLDRVLWNDGIDTSAVVASIGAMKRAWAVLDDAATAAGIPVVPPLSLECQLPDGSLVAIVAEFSGSELAPDGRRMAVYSTAEIGRMIFAAKSILTVKQEFPGAVVEQVRPRRPWVNDTVGDLLFG